MTATASATGPVPVGTARPRRRGGLVILALVVALVAGLGYVWVRGSVGGVALRERCTATALGNSTSLDPEQAGNAAIIAGIAVRRNLPGRAATIGIATAIQESKLVNIDYGDRDSIGLFQQRPSQGWGTVAQIMDPVYATNAFYDVLVKVEGYQDLSVTQAAQKVQRSAFPHAYADHEPEARIFASALAGYSQAALTCTLGPAPDLPAEPVGASGLTARAAAVVSAAAAETGRAGRSAGTADGRSVQFQVGGSEPQRLAWALAQWAVARAEGLNITAVTVQGQQWRRDASAQGWTTAPAADGSLGSSAAGEVVVQVA